MSGNRDTGKCWWQGWESHGMWSERGALDQTLPGASTGFLDLLGGVGPLMDLLGFGSPKVNAKP